MKKTLLFFLLLTAFIIDAQEKMTSTKGIIVFEASVPLFEPVKAINKEVNVVLNTERGSILFVVYIDRFSFERSLMQEHFNENYMESNRFPRAVFKGKIEKFDLKNLNSESNQYQITGKITIRGRTKKIVINGTLKKVGKGIELHTVFPLNTDDFKIDIPFIVRSKISKNVNTQLICVLQ